MTKRRVERDIDELSDELLGDLTPDERLQLMLEAQAEDKDAWMDRLRETAPRKSYQMTDLAYVERGRLALFFLQNAVYELHTTLLLHDSLDTLQMMRWALDLNRDEAPSEDTLDQAGERADQIKWLFAEVYTLYHAYRRFASDVLGVDIDTWFALHADGDLVLEAVRDLLDDEFRHELAAELVNYERHDERLDPDDPDWLSLDALAEQRYEAYAALWEETVAAATE